MRIAAPALLVLLASSPAHADNGKGAAFDFGYVRSRVGVTDQTSLDADQARFGIRIGVGRLFHFGAEVDNGRVQGQTALPTGTVSRTTGGEPYSGPLGGNSLSLKAYGGLHSIHGKLMLGGDAALGVRDTWVESDAGMDVAGYKAEPLIELRARAEYFLTSSMTFGAVASTDMLDRRNVSLAAVFSLNFVE
ncbi:MAG: hypothetical protein ACKV2T_32470 [Kofleriaceae bacterium]